MLTISQNFVNKAKFDAIPDEIQNEGICRLKTLLQENFDDNRILRLIKHTKACDNEIIKNNENRLLCFV